MKYRNRVLRLELKNKSSIGLNSLFGPELRLFASIVEKSDNLQNYNALTYEELNKLVKLFELMFPSSKFNNPEFFQLLDNMSEEMLKEYIKDLERIRKHERVNYRAEIKKEYFRRS